MQRNPSWAAAQRERWTWKEKVPGASEWPWRKISKSSLEKDGDSGRLQVRKCGSDFPMREKGRGRKSRQERKINPKNS